MGRGLEEKAQEVGERKMGGEGEERGDMARSSGVWLEQEGRGWEGLAGSKELLWMVLVSSVSKDRCACAG